MKGTQLPLGIKVPRVKKAMPRFPPDPKWRHAMGYQELEVNHNGKPARTFRWDGERFVLFEGWCEVTRDRGAIFVNVNREDIHLPIDSLSQIQVRRGVMEKDRSGAA